jgi:hypothetical protein
MHAQCVYSWSPAKTDGIDHNGHTVQRCFGILHVSYRGSIIFTTVAGIQYPQISLLSWKLGGALPSSAYISIQFLIIRMRESDSLSVLLEKGLVMTRKLVKPILALALVLAGFVASGAALAQYRGHGYGHGYGYGGNVRFGISLGFPIYGSGYYPAPYYAYPAYAYPAPVYPYAAPVYPYPAAVMGSSSPPVYVEQGLAQAAPAPAQAQGDWYYCAASNAYYPYVGECPAGWQRVPAQPPSH